MQPSVARRAKPTLDLDVLPWDAEAVAAFASTGTARPRRE
jgi:hypothetical protein